MTAPALALALAAALAAEPAPSAEAAEAAAAPPPDWSAAPPPPLARVPARPAPAPPLDVRLANGMRIVVVERHARPVVRIHLVFPRGAVSDPAHEAGVTWLAVHLATDFRERSERGETLPGEKSFRRQIGELGGAAWAIVQPDFSGLAVAGYAQDAARYLALLGEAVVSPRHGAESYSARREVLLDALDDLESSDQAVLDRVVAEAAFGAGHPYARSIIGTKQSLEPLGLEDVVAHQEALLAPAGATLLVVGDVRPERVVAEARKAFARWDRQALPPVAVPPPAAPRPGLEVGFLRRQPASTLIACVTRPLADVRGSEATARVLAAVLGGGLGGRLVQALREEGGASYVAWASVIRRRAALALVACAPVAAARAEDALRRFRAVLDGLRSRPPGEDELRRAKALLAADLEDAQDDVGRVSAAWVAAIALRGGVPRREQERAELDRVRAEDVRTLAAAALRPDTLRWILSGDPAVASRAVQASRLGRLVPLKLGR